MYTIKPSSSGQTTLQAAIRSMDPTDGLDTDSSSAAEVEVPGALTEALLRLKLLQGVPLAYLIPDPRLLPPESLRFFHVDPTWTDRLVDGALSAGRVGSLDLGFSSKALQGVRDHLDRALEERATLAYTRMLLRATGQPCSVANLITHRQVYSWPGREQAEDPPPLTGMLLHSELASRWPDMHIRAYQHETSDDVLFSVPVLRRERLREGLLIVIFAGIPTRVEIEEPPVGIRFGVELDETQSETSSQPRYSVCAREGSLMNCTLSVTLGPLRALRLDADHIKAPSDVTVPKEQQPWASSSRFAWWFLQPPYRQLFTPPTGQAPAVNEPDGSKAEAPLTLKVRRGRQVSLRPIGSR